MHVRRHGLDGYRGLFLRACLYDHTFDSQCEGGRTPWLMDFFEGSPEWLAEPLFVKLCQLNPEECQSWDQWCELAGRLAERGSAPALQGLYAAFHVDEDEHLWGCEQLLTVEGEKGLLWIARQLNRRQLLDHYTVRRLVEDFDELYGEGSAVAVLRGAPDEQVGKVLRRLQRAEPRWHTADRRPAESDLSPYEAVRLLSSYPLSRWAKAAGPETLSELAALLRTSRHPEVLKKVLFCFMGEGLPRFDQVLLKLAEHPEREIARRARWVMGHHRRPEVRQKALGWISRGELDNGRLRALMSCFQRPDIATLSSAVAFFVEEKPDRESLHCALSDLLELAKKNLCRELQPLLLLIYQNTPCTNCRLSSVETMLELEVLPDWVAEECRYDCEELIRKLVTGED